jgi:hypothetical protein
VTTSLCWVQAPSPKAVSRTPVIIIFFRNFNLSRLLSSQVAPVRLCGEPSGSNAFLNFFELIQISRTGSIWIAGVHYFLLLLCAVILIDQTFNLCQLC